MSATVYDLALMLFVGYGLGAISGLIVADIGEYCRSRRDAEESKTCHRELT